MIRKATLTFSLTSDLLAGASDDYYAAMAGALTTDAVVATIDNVEGFISSLAIQRVWVSATGVVAATFHNFGGSTITSRDITVHVALLRL